MSRTTTAGWSAYRLTPSPVLHTSRSWFSLYHYDWKRSRGLVSRGICLVVVIRNSPQRKRQRDLLFMVRWHIPNSVSFAMYRSRGPCAFTTFALDNFSGRSFPPQGDAAVDGAVSLHRVDAAPIDIPGTSRALVTGQSESTASDLRKETCCSGSPKYSWCKRC
jgi:hypothetical protein